MSYPFFGIVPESVTSCTTAKFRSKHAQRSRAHGFTLIELLVTIAIILTICAIAIPNLLAAVDQAKVARAVGDIRAIGDGVMEYNVLNNAFPNTLAEAGYGGLHDPWGNPYQYLNFANTKGKGKMRKDRFLVPNNTYFDLYSMGKDAQSALPLTAKASHDDIVWANDGSFIGLASQY